MIEYPEAATIAGQITATLAGRRIAEAMRGNTPHKFAFYSYDADKYARILAGRTMGAARAHGGHIVVRVEPGYALVLGGGGERIFLHQDARTLPKKHQFLLRFDDGDYLSVTVQMWGFIKLLEQSDVETGAFACQHGIAPLSDAFTQEYLDGLFAALPADDPSSIKYFLISKPGILGVGNGYTHDILFRSGLHPRRRAASLTVAEQQALHAAIRTTLSQATELGGRDSERDLFGRPGGYHCLLASTGAGTPCPRCGTPIAKIQFLGGASYLCPRCQPEGSIDASA